MIILDRKKPISALKLIHTYNHTQTNKLCDIHKDHLSLIKTLDFTIGERIYNLHSGIYKIIIDEIEYIIDIYYDLSNGDFLIINNADDISLFMAGSTHYSIIPYKINTIKNTESSYINTVNDSIDIIMIAGKTEFIGSPSLENPTKINRISNIKINSQSGLNTDSLSIALKHSLGKLPNGARDYIVINSEQMIAHYIINTSKEILSGGIDWEYKEEYSNDDYYVFFAKYINVKLNNTPDSIRCSHFESVSCDELLDFNNTKNCISTSYGDYENGIWIKIAASVLDIHGNKDFGQVMQKWILTQAVSSNPIYIEYQITNTMNKTILIDEYHVKTWYPITTVSVDNDFSIFYKALKSL